MLRKKFEKVKKEKEKAEEKIRRLEAQVETLKVEKEKEKEEKLKAWNELVWQAERMKELVAAKVDEVHAEAT